MERTDGEAQTTATRETGPEWVIVRDGGMWLVGQDHGETLSPVYELHCQTVPQPQGVEIRHIVQPLLLIASLDRWPLGPGAKRWPVAGSSIERQVMDGIANAERMVQQMRAAAVGISLAPAMPNREVKSGPGGVLSKLGRVPR